MNNGLTIRPYRSKDETAVIALFERFMQDVTPAGMSDVFRSYTDKAVSNELNKIEQYYALSRGSGFWVAESPHHGVVAMAGIERSQHNIAELRRMIVMPEFRRRGIARRLLIEAENFCRRQGYREIVLSTSQLQPQAIALYESSDYRLTHSEIVSEQSHKTVGSGLTRFFYSKLIDD